MFCVDVNKKLTDISNSLPRRFTPRKVNYNWINYT